MKLAYLDPFSGASGDMFLGAILDAGLPLRALRDELRKLHLEGYSLSAQKTQRGGIAATKASIKVKSRVATADEPHPHSNLPEILELIAHSDLPEGDQRQAAAVFQRLAEAEGRVHGCPPEKIHFHEVGAVDAIVDIVGTVVGLRLLGIERIVSGPVRTGMGFVTCAHGRLPVPAPATAELLKGFPTVGTDVEGELTTPTGAALLTTLADAFGSRPLMTIQAVGYGAGTATRETPPNLLRIFIGEVATEAEAAEESDEVLIIEANLDDITGEIIGYVLDRLFAAGALDAFLIPIHMKKNRPGVILQAIVEPANAPAIEQIILTETSTFGIRRTRAARRKLRRESVDVETRYGKIRVKVGYMGAALVHAAPEYEDCRRAAAEAAVPIKQVYDAATDAFRRR